VVLNTAIARLFFVGGVAAAAAMAQERGWGLLNWVDGPAWLELGLAVVLLDFIIYWQHQVFHLVPILWRFHMMNHSDLDLDVSSGVRFHPVEIVISTMVKAAAVLALGVALFAVVAFEIVLNSTALFNHSNVQMPVSLNRILRWFAVTPDMHRIHHSVDVRETNSNCALVGPAVRNLLRGTGFGATGDEDRSRTPGPSGLFEPIHDTAVPVRDAACVARVPGAIDCPCQIWPE